MRSQTPVREVHGFVAEMHSSDVIVLGAGIVGVSTALHLRRRGLQVALVDRKHPGEEASAGNAGIVQANGFTPHPVPLRPAALAQILLKQSTAITYDLKTLVRLAPWILDYHRAAQERNLQAYARVATSLRGLSLGEHRSLARLAQADRFYRYNGWLHVFRSAASFRKTEVERAFARIYGVRYEELLGTDINLVEAGLKTSGLSALYWPESHSVSNPAAVVDALWRCFIQLGGKYFRGDALSIHRHRGGWRMHAERAELSAPAAVVALGAWAPDLLAKFGETYPLVAKRGYHMHFRPVTGVSLSRPVVDIDNGFVLTPMERGIRLTTGVELAERDAPPNPAIIKMAKRRAQTLFPLGRALEEEPWMGSRPCLPDSLPIIGKSPVTPGLWLNIGHGHDGFTFGPVSGRLLAEMMVGQTPCIDPQGVAPTRFRTGRASR